MTENEFKKGKVKKSEKVNAALRDFHIFMPPKCDIKIKEGDDLDKLNLPDTLIQNLITEKVMKGK